MRTTLNLDDDLLANARGLTGLTEKSALVREALKALVEREAALRIARDAALQASVVRARFIATASHDLRQPLHAIAAKELAVPIRE